jgi:hypothetical protein
MKRSRSGLSGSWGLWCRIPPKYKAVRISTIETELDGWPDPALVVVSMM